MRMTRLLLITLFLVFSLLQPNASAPDYTKWDLPDGVTARLGKGWINGMAFSPDGIRLAVASPIGVWIYDVRAGNEKELDLLTADALNPISVAYSPDGTTLASGSDDKTVRLWDARTRKHITILKEHTDGVNSVVYSPDGIILASGSYDKTVRLWDARTGEHITTLTGHRGSVFSVVFSPDGTTLATGSSDSTIFLRKLR